MPSSILDLDASIPIFILGSDMIVSDFMLDLDASTSNSTLGGRDRP